MSLKSAVYIQLHPEPEMCLPNQPVKKSMTYIAHSSSYALLSQVLNNLYPCDVSTDTHLGIYHTTKKVSQGICQWQRC